MAAQLSRVAGEVGVSLVGVVGRRGVEEGVERHLGVDHDRPPADEPDHEVGSQRRVVAVAQVDLLLEVAAVDQAGQLDRTPQVELAPATAHLGTSQRRRQRLRLAAQAVGGVPHVEDLLVQLALPRRPCVLEVVELVAEPVEALHHLGLVDHRLPLPGDVRRSRARPEHAHGAPERESDREHQKERHHVHVREGARDHRQLWIP